MSEQVTSSDSPRSPFETTILAECGCAATAKVPVVVAGAAAGGTGAVAGGFIADVLAPCIGSSNFIRLLAGSPEAELSVPTLGASADAETMLIGLFILSGADSIFSLFMT